MYGCYMIEADPENWLKYAVRVFLSKDQMIKILFVCHGNNKLLDPVR